MSTFSTERDPGSLSQPHVGSFHSIRRSHPCPPRQRFFCCDRKTARALVENACGSFARDDSLAKLQLGLYTLSSLELVCRTTTTLYCFYYAFTNFRRSQYDLEWCRDSIAAYRKLLGLLQAARLLLHFEINRVVIIGTRSS